MLSVTGQCKILPIITMLLLLLQCYAPYKIIGYKIILPYFGQKNAKIIDPAFFPSHTVYYVYCTNSVHSVLSHTVYY